MWTRINALPMNIVKCCVAGVVVWLAMLPALAFAGTQPVIVQLTPSTVAPGGSVFIRAMCTSGTSATVSSSAFASATLGVAQSGGGLIALVTVSSGISPGTFTVNVSCASGEAGTATLTVAPSGGATTGDGTMAPAGPTWTLVGLGLAFLAAAACALAVALRRRSPDAAT